MRRIETRPCRVASQRVAERRGDRRLRPEHLGPRPLPRARPARRRDHRAPRRGARGRRAGHAAAAHRGGDRPLRPRRRRRRRATSRRSRSTASGTPRSTAGPASSTPSAIEAVVCHSDMEPTGRFHCSHDGLNRLHDNVRWSMRGNFVDVPTDCPQRDERLGWTGDIQVFAPAATFLYDCAALAHVLAGRPRRRAARDRHRARLRPLGAADLSPAAGRGVGGRRGRASRGCSTSASATSRCWRASTTACGRGSSRSPRSPVTTTSGTRASSSATGSIPLHRRDDPGAARTDKALVATAYHAHTARLLAGAAAVLGHDDRPRPLRRAGAPRSRRPSTTSSSRRPAGWRATPRRPTRSPCASTCSRASRSGSGPRPRLAELVRRDDYRIGTGFVGTPLVCDALVDAGLVDDAYHLLLQTDCPSWLYPVTMGATTMWERWDSVARRRIDQPQRDDLVQPLRPRRGRRLPAPGGRRAGARPRPATGSCTSPPAREVGSPTPRPRCGHRTGTPACGGSGPAIGSSSMSSCPPAARLGSSCPANPPPTSVRGRTASNAHTARPHSTRRGRQPEDPMLGELDEHRPARARDTP